MRWFFETCCQIQRQHSSSDQWTFSPSPIVESRATQSDAIKRRGQEAFTGKLPDHVLSRRTPPVRLPIPRRSIPRTPLPTRPIRLHSNRKQIDLRTTARNPRRDREKHPEELRDAMPPITSCRPQSARAIHPNTQMQTGRGGSTYPTTQQTPPLPALPIATPTRWKRTRPSIRTPRRKRAH